MLWLWLYQTWCCYNPSTRWCNFIAQYLSIFYKNTTFTHCTPTYIDLYNYIPSIDMVLQSDISLWQLVYNRNTTSKGKSDALTKKPAESSQKPPWIPLLLLPRARLARTRLSSSLGRHIVGILGLSENATTTILLLQTYSNALHGLRGIVLWNILYILKTFTLFGWLLPLSNLDPDHLCLLLRIAACYFLLVT